MYTHEFWHKTFPRLHCLCPEDVLDPRCQGVWTVPVKMTHSRKRKDPWLETQREVFAQMDPDIKATLIYGQ